MLQPGFAHADAIAPDAAMFLREALTPPKAKPVASADTTATAKRGLTESGARDEAMNSSARSQRRGAIWLARASESQSPRPARPDL